MSFYSGELSLADITLPLGGSAVAARGQYRPGRAKFPSRIHLKMFTPLLSFTTRIRHAQSSSPSPADAAKAAIADPPKGRVL